MGLTLPPDDRQPDPMHPPHFRVIIIMPRFIEKLVDRLLRYLFGGA